MPERDNSAESTRRIPSSIECEVASVKARRINMTGSRIHEILNELVYITKLQRTALAKIQEELNPKRHVLDSNSSLNYEDEINGTSILCLSKGYPKRIIVGTDSGRHRAQFSQLRDYAYCRVIARNYDLCES